jgi:CubicO group peptidase (beta-lactamase class C family)
LMIFLNGSSGAARQAAVNPTRIDEFIPQQMLTQRVPALALAITQGGRVLYVKGYGTAGKGQPITAKTQFLIASVSKSFTALAVLQLVEAGRIDLDAPVQKYLPEFTLADPQAASQITVRHLLNQISGLSEIGFADMQLPQPKTIEERLTSLRMARPVAKPGAEYHYFSPNYGILARFVEVASGQSFSAYLHENVFTPLEMNSSFHVVTSTQEMQEAERLAPGHLLAFGIPFPYPEAPGYLGGSGGVITTAEDMAHVLICQNNGGRCQDQQLVTSESLNLMHTPPTGIKSSYAMGWQESTVAGQRILEHTGIISTYSADAVLMPEEKIGLAILYNISSFPTNIFGAPQIRDGLISLLMGKEPESSGMNVKLWGWIIALLTLAGGFSAIRSLLFLPRWTQVSEALPVWRLVPGIVWAFAPILANLGLPWLTARFADRIFGFANFYKSMLGILVWLGLTGILGATNGMARIVIILRRLPG